MSNLPEEPTTQEAPTRRVATDLYVVKLKGIGGVLVTKLVRSLPGGTVKPAQVSGFPRGARTTKKQSSSGTSSESYIRELDE